LVQEVEAVGEGEGKPARRMSFAMMLAQVACFGDEFSQGLMFGIVGRIVAATDKHR
jgi:hypothetical protein